MTSAKRISTATNRDIARRSPSDRGDGRAGLGEAETGGAANEGAGVRAAGTSLRLCLRLSANSLASAKRWLELDKDNDEAVFHLARLQLRLGKLRQSRQNYKKLIELGDVPPDERLLALIGVLTEEDPEGGDEIMRWLAKPYKDSPYAHYAVAVTALQVDDVEHSQKRALRAIELKPDWMRPKLIYGRTLLIAGDPEAAIDYIARLIGDDPQPDPDARMELALVMMAAGREDDALSQVNQIQYETGNEPDALRLMAILNFRQENLDAAWEDFQDLLSTGRHTMDALFYLARISDFRGETERAIRLYSQVKEGTHTVTAQRRASALLAFQRNAPDTAIEQLDEFARDNPAFAIDMVPMMPTGAPAPSAASRQTSADAAMQRAAAGCGDSTIAQPAFSAMRIL